jgi:hypothetical protein
VISEKQSIHFVIYVWSITNTFINRDESSFPSTLGVHCRSDYRLGGDRLIGHYAADSAEERDHGHCYLFANDILPTSCHELLL